MANMITHYGDSRNVRNQEWDDQLQSRSFKLQSASSQLKFVRKS